MSDFLSADAASNSGSSPSTNNDPQTADISAMAGESKNPEPRELGEAPLRLVETAFLASTASLIWLVNYYFPLGPLLRVFFPIPIALVYLRWGNRAAWMTAFVSGLLLSVLMGPTRSILYVIPFGIMGVALGGLWRRKASWSLSISVGALIGTVGFFFRFWLLSALVGQDLWVYVTAQVTEIVEWVFVKLGWLSVPSVSTIGAIAAGMILVNNIVYLFVVHLVALLLLDRLGNPIPRPPRWVQVLIDYEE
ncbi:DUF2232 domain-containing protein [Microcoleus sp. AR_TQ3_B6]|uniref:DUF2232 domain-containing protein n=1 Tax=Microcoleus sp. AR_TQ3_B6 TaxID=3055284 RepID=UPI002FD35DA2